VTASQPASEHGRGPADASTVARRARTSDVTAIRALVDHYAFHRVLLDKPTVTLYEDVQEFWVAERAGTDLLGCGALHVLLEDLA
jgi:amino-acid N-acetyltransferase